MIRGHPIDTRDDTGRGKAKVATSNPDAVQEDSLGDAVRCGTDHPCSGRTVAITVLAAATAPSDNCAAKPFTALV
jgi:hypothetical protein